MIVEPTYEQLLLRFPPRPITDETQFWATQQQVDVLLSQDFLTQEEDEYLNLLGTLIYIYEEATVTIPEMRGVRLIRQLLIERNLRQKDLIPIFKTESIVSDVLNGKRRLTAEHIDRLAYHFELPHHLFFD